ncbi:Ribonuclease CAF1 [Trinorchestia longiramus]|nr:Ribonuclease CAF1 [Trinorchestia longiramus]
MYSIQIAINSTPLRNMEDNLPVAEVVSSNMLKLWPHLLSAIRQASFIALDIEMSGLGEKKKLFYSEIDVRYKYTAELARSHAPVSLGISCFRCSHASVEGEQYCVESFDLLVLNEHQFCVQSSSLKFLRHHGFDFNKLVDDGLPYTPGCDLHVGNAFISNKHMERSSNLPTNGSTSSSLHANSSSVTKPKVDFTQNDGCSISSSANCSSKAQKKACVKESASLHPNVRTLFAYIIKHQKPIVLHNGLVDLTFLYQHFYTELPKSSETFAANLYEMFPMGIYDTKYFSEFVYRDPASYLQIVYLQERLLNSMAGVEGRPSVDVSFTSAFSSLPGVRLFHLQSAEPLPHDGTVVCNSYAYHGWCDLAESCPDSHDLQRIVQLLFKTNQSGRRKLRNATRRSRVNSTGTNTMLMSALKHNAQHKKLLEGKKLSNLSNDSAGIVSTSNGDSSLLKVSEFVVQNKEIESSSLERSTKPVENSECCESRISSVLPAFTRHARSELLHDTNSTTNNTHGSTGITDTSISITNELGIGDNYNLGGITVCPDDVTSNTPYVTAECPKVCVGNGDILVPSRGNKRSLSRRKESAAKSCSVETSSEASGKSESSLKNCLQSETHKRRLIDVSAEADKPQWLNEGKSCLSMNDPKFLTSNDECVLESRDVECKLISVSSGGCESANVDKNGYTDNSVAENRCEVKPTPETVRKLDPIFKDLDAATVKKGDTNHEVKSNERNEATTENIESRTKQNGSLGSLSEGHSSGIDAFKTGFIFASYIRRAGKLRLPVDRPPFTSSTDAVSNGNAYSCGSQAAGKLQGQESDVNFTPQTLGMSGEVNKVYLMGKSFPFLVRKSPFAKVYKNHLDKITSIRLQEM